MQFLGVIKKVASPFAFIQNAKVAGKFHGFGRHKTQNRSESQCSGIIQELMNMGKYVYVGSWVKYALSKSSGVFKNMPVPHKNRRITVSVILPYFQPTALLLKKFILRLHCYTQTLVSTHFFESTHHYQERQFPGQRSYFLGRAIRNTRYARQSAV